MLYELLAQASPQGLPLGGGALDFAAKKAAAGEVGHEAAETKGAVADRGQGRDGGVAATAQAALEDALGAGGSMGVGVIYGSGESNSLRVVGAGLQGKGPLADSREHDVEGEDLGSLLKEAEAGEAGGGQDDAIVVAALHLAETGVDVAADVSDGQVGPVGAELSGAAGAAGADGGAGRHIGQLQAAAGDEGVTDFPTRRDGGDKQAFGGPGRQVFEAVDGDADVAPAEGFLQLGDEDAAAADL